jgi:hypothetical protein
VVLVGPQQLLLELAEPAQPQLVVLVEHLLLPQVLVEPELRRAVRAETYK